MYNMYVLILGEKIDIISSNPSNTTTFIIILDVIMNMHK